LSARKAELAAALLVEFQRSHGGREPTELESVRIGQAAALSARAERPGIGDEDLVRLCRINDRILSQLSIKPSGAGPRSRTVSLGERLAAERAHRAARSASVAVEGAGTAVPTGSPTGDALSQPGAAIHGSRPTATITGTAASSPAPGSTLPEASG
jgi:hypothetical protein